MHVIVVGCGKVGSRFAALLDFEGHDVSVIDSSPDKLRQLDQNFDGLLIKGVPIDQDILKKAGVEICDALIAVTDDDNMNIMVCQIAKQIFSVKKAVARIYSPERAKLFSDNFGIETFCPTNTTVEAIHALMLGDKDSAEHVIGPNKFIFQHSLALPDQTNKTISDIIYNKKSFILGLIRNGHFMFAFPEVKVISNDILINVIPEE